MIRPSATPMMTMTTKGGPPETGGGAGHATAVIVPVKSKNPKGRLSSLLDPAQRRQLQIAMLEDTLQTLIRARMVGHTFVVSSDAQILEFAKRFGAMSVAEPQDAGVNSAAQRGLQAAASYARRLIIPADLPLLAVEDLKIPTTLAREGAQLVISPSETFDGTNLLLLTEEDVSIPLSYDDDSFRKHFAAANALGLRVAVYYSRGVGFDIDRPTDLHRFFRFRRRGSTLTFLGRTLEGRKTSKARPRSS
jgi:2-phospho-L-lactate/phosphoenolpyruvate guanylyltransferase